MLWDSGNWQEHALSPGEATPATPFLGKGVFLLTANGQPTTNKEDIFHE